MGHRLISRDSQLNLQNKRQLRLGFLATLLYPSPNLEVASHNLFGMLIHQMNAQFLGGCRRETAEWAE